MFRLFSAHRPKAAKSHEAPSAAPKPRAASVSREALERAAGAPAPAGPQTGKPKEIGGPSGPEPTRYGDWERNGICVDF